MALPQAWSLNTLTNLLSSKRLIIGNNIATLSLDYERKIVVVMLIMVFMFLFVAVGLVVFALALQSARKADEKGSEKHHSD